ncbi:MAG: peptidoglycan-binding domain-containing protein, partial [Hyphomicrobium sp.]
LQSHVLTQAGEVLHRYRSDTVANTGVSTLAFMDQRDHFARATILHERADIRRMQRALSQSGYYPGPLDGRYSPDLREAIEKFEAAERRPKTGLASSELLRRLETVVAGRGGDPRYEPSSDQLETGSVPRPRPSGP